MTCLLLSFVAFAQDSSKDYYIYNIIHINGGVKSEGLTVNIDNGQSVDKLKDDNGKVIKFKTTAAILMYFISKDWELFVSGSSTSGSSAGGYGAVTTNSYWIIRKLCTEEEFNNLVREGRKK